MVCLNYNSLSLFHMKLLLNTGAYDLSQTREIIRNCWFFFFQIHPSTSTIVFLFYGPPVFQRFIFYVQLFLPLISIHLSKISRNLSLLSLLLLFYFYFQFTIFYTLPCWGEWSHCFSVMSVFFF